MEYESSIKAIEILVSGIDKHINSLNIETKDNLLEYKYKDLYDIKSLVRVCSRCNKVFIPKYSAKSTQQFCTDDCRYNSTQATRKQLKQDARYKMIDNLRKLIYERRYRARRDRQPLTSHTESEFDSILEDLKSLTTQRKYISEDIFAEKYKKLHTRYKNTAKW